MEKEQTFNIYNYSQLTYMNTSWNIKAPAKVAEKIHINIDSTEFINMKSKGYGVAVVGWIFHESHAITLSPRGSYSNFSKESERQDVFEVFGFEASLQSGFEGLFYFPQGEKKHHLKFDIITAKDDIIGELNLKIGGNPGLNIFAMGRWLLDNCNRANFTAAWHMLKEGNPLKIWRSIQVAVSASSIGNNIKTTMHLLDTDLLKKSEKKETNSNSISIIDIIIPVYNGPKLLSSLLNSIRKNTHPPYRLIIIDDASTDPEIESILQTQQPFFEDCTIIRNERNMGFVKSVNIALSQSKHNVVILNSDTEVPENWLPRLVSPFTEDSKIASVTPMTNSGTIASFPDFCEDNDLIFDADLKQIDTAFQKINGDYYIEVPTGVGFCMAMRREVLEQIGFLDEATFHRGYGEENDWCQRAERSGYKNVIQPSLFVWHKGGGSFHSKEKENLFQKNYRKLIDKHPDYESKIQAFIRTDNLYTVRFLALLFLLQKMQSRAVCIIIDHDMGGGANLYSAQKIVKEKEQHHILHISFCLDYKMFKITLYYQKYCQSLYVKDESDLESFLRSVSEKNYFYNNMAKYPDPLRIVKFLDNELEQQGNSLTIAIHDYLPICPTYILLNNDSWYCGLPKEISECVDCLKKNRYSIIPNVDIVEWRQHWQNVLDKCYSILTFSKSSKALLRQIYEIPPEKIEVTPHKLLQDFTRKPKLDFSKELHIGVVGGINIQKGARIVADLVKEMERMEYGKLTIIGKLADVSIQSKRFHITGAYDSKDLPDLIEKSGANIFLVPSIWPETFCYIASELMILEVPVVCFDIGAPCERLKYYHKGLVLPVEPKARNTIKHLNAFFDRHKI